jgi:hypothetical protein
MFSSSSSTSERLERRRSGPGLGFPSTKAHPSTSKAPPATKGKDHAAASFWENEDNILFDEIPAPRKPFNLQGTRTSSSAQGRTSSAGPSTSYAAAAAKPPPTTVPALPSVAPPAPAGATPPAPAGATEPPLAKNSGQLIQKPIFHKSVSQFAMTMNFRGFGLTAAEVIRLVHTSVKGAEAVQFLPVTQAVEVAFLDETSLLSALSIGLEVKSSSVPVLRCFRKDPLAMPISVQGVPIFARQDTRAEIAMALSSYGEVVDLGFDHWEGTSLRNGVCGMLFKLDAPTASVTSSFPTYITIRGVECPLVYKKDTEGRPSETAAPRAPPTPKTPSATIISHDKTRAARQKAWDKYSADFVWIRTSPKKREKFHKE